MVKYQGKSWTDILWEHLDQTKHKGFLAASKTRALGVDLSTGEDQSVLTTGRLSGTKFDLIIIDECEPLLSEELYEFMRELGVKEKKPAKPFKQPNWARFNQAPRSVRKRR